jgi:RNA polymerase sigma-70 factor, ECF subfamily
MNPSEAESAMSLPALVGLSAHPSARAGPKRRPTAAVEIRMLTEAICRGEEAAFTRFYELFSFRLYKYLLVLARGNEGDAREVVQTVVLKLAGRFKVFEREEELWSWLCRSARNAYVDHYRARQRQQRFLPLEPWGSAHAAPAKDEGTWRMALEQALNQLPPADSELLRAAYVDRQPLQTLADDSGQSYKALESRLARLRQKLKGHLLIQLRHEKKS